ncbi:MAG TPA: hypothetical protein VKH35_15895 [Thermoanaerobaculia bacterium]|nr:hypothetical protein [Thermoanaerobaculia bacterium]
MSQASRSANHRHYRNIAGTIEFFLGVYFLDFGFLAGLFFLRQLNRTAVMLAAAGALFGILLIFRAGRLLAWHRWFFWFLTTISILVPIGWFIPTLIRLR